MDEKKKLFEILKLILLFSENSIPLDIEVSGFFSYHETILQISKSFHV